MNTSSRWLDRRVGLALVLVTALVGVILGLRIWWNHGENDDRAAWAQAKQETSWLAAIVEPEAEMPTPPCVDSTKLAVISGNVMSGDSARGRTSIRKAQSRLIHEGWLLSRKEKVDNGDGLGPRQFDWFERKISGRTVKVTFVGEQLRRTTVHRAAPEPPGVTITMEPKFCGF